MVRPKSECKIGYCPEYSSFKPQGCNSGGHVEITAEEIESMRLKNVRELDQTSAASEMGISQSTFQRILTSAYKKVSVALVEGKELRIIRTETGEK